MAVVSIYHELIQYETFPTDLIAKLDELGLYGCFEPLIAEYGNKEVFPKVLFYILHVYSKQSRFVIDGLEYTEIKNRVLDRVGITKEYEDHSDPIRHDLKYLMCAAVATTVKNYLCLQFARLHLHLMTKRELYQQMLHSSVDIITSKDNVVLWDQKRKNSKYADELYAEIGEWENRLAEDSRALLPQIEEVEERTKEPVLPGNIRFETVLRQTKQQGGEEPEDE